MNKIEILVSTMNRENINFIHDMNIATDAVVVNQNNSKENKERLSINNNQVKLINSLDRGLSKSRNVALENSTAEICVMADDDVTYDNDYKEKIIQAYKDHPQADIIAFQVKRVGKTERPKVFRDKKSFENYITSMKISSVEMTFKREKIIENNIKFDPNFGAGAEFYQGEENIFIYDALSKGLEILYLPVNIAEVEASESTWFEGYNKEYLQSMGAKFYRMSPKYYRLLIFQYGARKYKNLYKSNFTLSEVFKHMNEGKNLYKQKYGKNE